jgi:hypothetical protein
MKDYCVNVFYSEEDEAYVADIPDLKFCSALGDTPEEAVREVQVARSKLGRLSLLPLPASHGLEGNQRL